jgi:hypothetical protein
MNITDALQKYEKDTETFYRQRQRLQNGEVGIKLFSYVKPHISLLNAFPPKPNPVWIVKPSDLTGDEQMQGGAFRFSKFVKVGEHVFCRGNGRSTKGRNALRYGRLNWPETVRLYEEWWDVCRTLTNGFEQSLREIELRWSLWAWDEGEKCRVYINERSLWWALSVYPGVKGFVVSSSFEKSKLHMGWTQIVKTTNSLLEAYPFFDQALKELEARGVSIVR